MWADGQRRRLTASGDSLVFPENHSSQMLDRLKPGSSSLNSRNVGLETVDVIDLDGFNLDEEDSWLYKPRDTPKDSPNPYAWVRQEFECQDIGGQPKSLLNVLGLIPKRKVSRHLEFVEPKKNVVSPDGLEPACVCRVNHPVNELQANNRRNNALENLEKLESPGGSAISDSPLPSAGDLVPSGDGNSEVALKSKDRHEIDTRTFTRPKKNKASVKTLTPIKLDVGLLPDSVPIEVVDLGNKDGVAPKKEDDVEHPLAETRQPEQTCLKLDGPTNVQVVARMQEESLRSSCSSPLSYTPKTQRRVLSESCGRLSQDGSQGSLSCSPDVSILNLSRDDPACVAKSTNSLSSGGSESSASRSESLLNVIPTQVKCLKEYGSSHPRSLPNLTTAAKFGLPRSLPSDSKLYASAGQSCIPSKPVRTKAEDETTSRESHLVIKAKDVDPPVDPNPTSVEPKIPAVVRPSSGIPKPNFTSKLKQPTKWKKNLTTPTQNDRGWKEGCF